MSDAMLMFGLTTVVTLISAVFWRWVSSISKALDKDGDQIDGLKAEVDDLRSEVYRNYQSKTDAHRDSEQIISMLRDIKKDVAKLSDKLDNKADK